MFGGGENAHSVRECFIRSILVMITGDISKRSASGFENRLRCYLYEN